MMEAYVNGVSTRRVDRLVDQLGIQGMSKDRVSELCRALDERVDAFRSRPLEGDYPTSGSTPNSFGSETAATCARRRWWSPTTVAPSGRRPCAALATRRPCEARSAR